MLICLNVHPLEVGWTTSSGWKLLIFVSFEIYPLPIPMFRYTFCSQYQWFDQQIKQIKYSRITGKTLLEYGYWRQHCSWKASCIYCDVKTAEIIGPLSNDFLCLLQGTQKELRRLRDQESRLATDLSAAHREISQLKVVVLETSPEASV